MNQLEKSTWILSLENFTNEKICMMGAKNIQIKQHQYILLSEYECNYYQDEKIKLFSDMNWWLRLQKVNRKFHLWVLMVNWNENENMNMIKEKGNKEEEEKKEKREEGRGWK